MKRIAAVIWLGLTACEGAESRPPSVGAKTQMICADPPCGDRCWDFVSGPCSYSNGCTGQTVCNPRTGGVTCNATGSRVACGQCGAGGYRVCSTNGAIGTCRPATPTTETCNGCDDNANGQVDEGLDGTSCSLNGCSAIFRCQGGVGQCLLTASSRKACADCTNGTAACNVDGTYGTCQPAVASGEACNRCDDDQNGTVDDLPANRACTRPDGCAGVLSCAGGVDSCVLALPSTRPCSACGPRGVQFCFPGGAFGPCRPPFFGTEACNGCDDDLDGVADNNLDLRCDACTTRACVNGAWTSCSIPLPELCNGKDDNCNQDIDEGGACNACAL